MVMQDFDTRAQGLQPESCLWLDLGNKSNLLNLEKDCGSG